MIACMLRLGATTVEPPEFSNLVNGSDYIVHAITKSVTSEKRAQTHGVKIVTLVELEIVEVVAGKPPEKVTLQMLGGRVGTEQLTVEGAPRFAVGDEDILFVSGNGRTFCPLYAMMHGRYPVLMNASTGRKYVARNDHSPLVATTDVAKPLGETVVTARAVATSALTPADFIREIKANIKLGSRLDQK
jgi:hypothetical protein